MTNENIEIGGVLPATLVRGLAQVLVDDGVDAGAVKVNIVPGRKLEISSPWEEIDRGFRSTKGFCVEYGMTFRQQTVYHGGDIVLVAVYEFGMDRPDSYQYLCEKIVVPICDSEPERVERVRYLDRLVVPPLTFAGSAVVNLENIQRRLVVEYLVPSPELIAVVDAAMSETEGK
jgi:hypothetical protein